MDQEPTDVIPAERPARPEGDPLMTLIAKAASNPKVDVDKLDHMLRMLERREDKAKEMAFNDALSAAKGEFPDIVRNRLVDFAGQKGRTYYRYEDFAAITDAVDPILKKYGLTYRFRSDQPAPGKLRVTCIVTHKHGHREETSLEVAEDTSGSKNAVQAIGSSATYLQRYTLKLALGLSVTTDDDGRGGVDNTTADPTIDDDQLVYLQDLMQQAGYRRETLEDWAGCKLEAMKVKKYEEALFNLRAKIRKSAVQHEDARDDR
jgi:hypothetical protein